MDLEGPIIFEMGQEQRWELYKRTLNNVLHDMLEEKKITEEQAAHVRESAEGQQASLEGLDAKDTIDAASSFARSHETA